MPMPEQVVSMLQSYKCFAYTAPAQVTEWLYFVREASSLAPAPAQQRGSSNSSNEDSDSSSSSNNSSRDDESASTGQPAKKQAAEKASVAGSAAEFFAKQCATGARFRYPEWLKLAELVLVLVPGSVEDERVFSSMKYLKNPQRSSLQEQHLTACARGFRHDRFSLASFPYGEAIGHWLDGAKKRGRYGV